MNKYVLGFMFDEDLENLSLIRKNKPKWQKGLLNGIGGKIEEEASIDAMVREFREETGYLTKIRDWKYFCEMRGENNDKEDFYVDCYVSKGDICQLESPTKEEVTLISIEDISNRWKDEMIDNLPWLIHLALDHIKDGKPYFTRVIYA